MNNYEKRIGLKSIYLTFVRHFVEMLIIFVPIAIVSLIVTKGFIKPSYSASVTFTKSTTFTTAHYETLVRTMKSDEAAAAANISKKQYNEGLSYPTSYTNNAKSELVFSFKSNNKNIPVNAINAAAEYAKAAINEKAPLDKELSFTAASGTSTNDSSNKYLLIALAVDLVLSLGVPFIFEIVGDQVYDRDDIEYLGCGGFEISASKAK